ncbi:hypothetical protein F5888DRAFT_1619594 [Russula emetica]|nr:hypothetical protein F5888DRAFT_1619594 [Russula emetica]
MSLLLLLTLHPSPNVGRNPGDIYPAVPLAVRSPYLNCWLHDNENVSTSGQTWPTTFNPSQILGWSVLVRVDDLTYSFLGDVDPNLVNGTVNLNSTFFAIGPTYTLLSGHAGPMQVNLTFRNPIEPGDWVKQSIPFSYMSFTASSSDGAGHYVQVYSDVSGEWSSGDRTQQILWSPTINADAVFHSVGLQKQETFTEILDQAEWGTLYYAMRNVDNVTYQADSDADSRGNFTRNGQLNSRQRSNLQFISDGSAVFAISRDLGFIQVTQESVVWAIGYTTDVAINYTDLSGTPTSRSPYYKTKYSNDSDLASIVDFLNDFDNASSRADQVNLKITNNSDSVVVALGQMIFIAIAEVYGSMQLTTGTDAHGNPDVLMFMKNIGGVQKNRVNAVETLYAAFPALMYLDPSLGAPLLEPLFRLQASHNYTLKYAAADLGSNYPNVSGGDLNHNQGVEQTGNMLIMTYAYARASGDGSLISRYYPLLTTWANYLNASTLFISNQSSADNLTVNNQTNLAIKGIIAIEAMSKMSSVVNHKEDANKYSSAAASLYAQWKNLALSSDQHLLAVYGQSDSWTLGYNLFADVWLGTNLVESLVYSGQSNFIYTLLSNPNFSNFGLPVDNADANADLVIGWSLFVAAMTNDEPLRSELIVRVSDRSSNTSIPASVFSVYYDSANGTSLQGVAR